MLADTDDNVASDAASSIWAISELRQGRQSGRRVIGFDILAGFYVMQRIQEERFAKRPR